MPTVNSKFLHAALLEYCNKPTSFSCHKPEETIDDALNKAKFEAPDIAEIKSQLLNKTKDMDSDKANLALGTFAEALQNSSNDLEKEALLSALDIANI